MDNLAVRNATHLDDIGFAEFTSKLVTSTFDALISANIRQTEAYSELVAQTEKTLTGYVNDTKDEISGDEIRDFLTSVLPAKSGTEDDSAVVRKATLSSPQVDTLNKALTVKTPEGPEINTNIVPESGNLDDDDTWNALLDAVATRISANKYTLLTEIVKMGVMRLVVENGVIETRLKFDTWDYSRKASSSSSYERDTRNSSAGGGFSFFFAGASAKTKSTQIRVSTSRQSTYGSDKTSINIYGGVKINFKTDYQPLLEG